MSQVLYRKYRPQSFDEVVGQDHIVEALQTAIKKGSVSHAYLFHGGRGTGKTSIARILARELGTTMKDLYEIDAASNRGIDDIRELREGVKTLPFDSKYKVYIIDEAHMLTKEAWNALLKTLEEPPAHVLFVMATTELHKIPETILSRSEIHTFREPSQATLSSVVVDIAKKEGYKIDGATAELISIMGEGSFRDTLGALQRVISSAKSKSIDETELESALLLPRRASVRDFLESFVAGDRDKALQVSHEVFSRGTPPKLFLKLVLHLARMALLQKVSKSSEEYVNSKVSLEESNFIGDLLKSHGDKLSSKTLLSLIEAYEYTEMSPIPELGIELILADLGK